MQYLPRKVGPRPVKTWARVPPAPGPKVYSQIMTGSLSFTGADASFITKLLVAILSFAGALLNTTVKLFTSVASLTGQLLKLTAKTLAISSLSFGGLVYKAISKLLAGTLACAGVLYKGSVSTFKAMLSFAGTFADVKITLLTFIGALSLKGTIANRIQSLLRGGVAFIPLSKSVTQQHLQSVLRFAGNFRASKLQMLVFVGRLSFTSKMIRQINHLVKSPLSFSGKRIQAVVKAPLTGAIRVVGILIKRPRKIFLAVVPFIGSSIRALGRFRTFSSGIAFAGHLRREVGKFLSGALRLQARLQHTSYKTLVATASLSGRFVRSTNKSLHATVTAIGAWQRTISLHRLMNSGLSFIGIIRKNTYHTIKTILFFAGHVNKGRKMIMSSSISFVGQIFHGPATLIVILVSRIIKRFRSDTDQAVLIEDSERENEPYQQHSPK